MAPQQRRSMRLQQPAMPAQPSCNYSLYSFSGASNLIGVLVCGTTYIGRRSGRMVGVDGSTNSSFRGSPLLTFLNTAEYTRLDVRELKKRRAVLDSDDTFQAAFLSTLCFVGIKEPVVDPTDGARFLMKSWGNRSTMTVSADLADGHYFLLEDGLYQLSKVFPDTQRAFVVPLISDERVPNHFTALQCSPLHNEESHGIAVQARCYSQGSSAPLRGCRLAVSEDYDIAGQRTSCGSNSFSRIQPLTLKSAEIVQTLLAMGCQLVGKTHTSMFGLVEHPAAERLEVCVPGNPRADGCQLPGGSCGGAAVAIASYAWLDVTLALDTLGSARAAARQNGVFSFRLSPEHVSTKGIPQQWLGMDSPAVFVHDLHLLPSIIEGLIPDTSVISAQVVPFAQEVELVCIMDNTPLDYHGQWILYRDFIDDIRNVTSATIRKVNLQSDWRRFGPGEDKQCDLRSWLFRSMTEARLCNSWVNHDKFAKQYQKIYGGAEPELSDAVRQQLERGKRFLMGDYLESQFRLGVFRQWFKKHYQRKDNVLIVVAGGIAEPRYRTQLPYEPIGEVMTGCLADFLSSLLMAPELTIPVATTPFVSDLTGEQEQLPVCISFIGPIGRDVELVDWTRDALRACRRHTKVQVGKDLWQPKYRPDWILACRDGALAEGFEVY